MFMNREALDPNSQRARAMLAAIQAGRQIPTTGQPIPGMVTGQMPTPPMAPPMDMTGGDPGPISGAPPMAPASGQMMPPMGGSPNPWSMFMGPGRFGAAAQIPGAGYQLGAYDPRAGVQQAIQAALAQQAANPWKPPTAPTTAGAPQQPFNPFRRPDRANAADPNPDVPHRPFSDLGPFIGGMFRNFPMVRAFNAITGGAGPSGGGRAGATDSHGQVRGGGTGSRSGGLTAGGPR